MRLSKRVKWPFTMLGSRAQLFGRNLSICTLIYLPLVMLQLVLNQDLCDNLIFKCYTGLLDVD